MTRTQRNGEKPEQLSLRIPKDVADKIDEFKEKEGTDRSVIILRAVRYWISVGGNVTNDNEYLNRLNSLFEEMQHYRNLCAEFQKERQGYIETIKKQQGTIETLLELIKEKK